MPPTSWDFQHSSFPPAGWKNSSARCATELPTRTFIRLCPLAAKSAARSRAMTTTITTDDRLKYAWPSDGEVLSLSPGRASLHFASAFFPAVSTTRKSRSERRLLFACSPKPELITGADRLAVRKDDLQQLLAVNLAAGFVRQRGDDFFRLDINHLAG